MVEDDLANLKTAHKIGMKTVFINKRITKITQLKQYN